MRLTVIMNLDNDAYHFGDEGEHLDMRQVANDVRKQVAEAISDGLVYSQIRDINGNVVGHFRIGLFDSNE